MSADCTVGTIIDLILMICDMFASFLNHEFIREVINEQFMVQFYLS